MYFGYVTIDCISSASCFLPQPRVNKKPTVQKGWKYFWSCYKSPPCGSKPTFIQSSSSWEKAEEQADISDSTGLLTCSHRPFPKPGQCFHGHNDPKLGMRRGMEACTAVWRGRSLREVQNPPHLYLHLFSPSHSPSPHCYHESTGLCGNCLSTADPPGKGALGLAHLHNPDKWQETGMTVIMGHCASSGGKPLRLQVDTMDNYGSFKPGGRRVLQLLCLHGSASYKRPLKFPDFYAWSTYTIKSFLKQLNCPQVLCKKTQLARRNKKYAREREKSNRHQEFWQINPQIKKKKLKLSEHPQVCELNQQ